MANKFMYIPNDDYKITPYVDYNQWLKSVDIELNEPNNQNKRSQGF